MFERVLTRALLGCAFVLIAHGQASAQLVNDKWQAPAKSGVAAGGAPRQGVEARPSIESASSASTAGNGAVPVRVIPAVVMSNGAVYADFGAGMELVRRACPSSANSMPLRVVGHVPSSAQSTSGVQPVPGMQPAPAQLTSSQLAVSSVPARPASQAAQSSCHLRDARGRAFATR